MTNNVACRLPLIHLLLLDLPLPHYGYYLPREPFQQGPPGPLPLLTREAAPPPPLPHSPPALETLGDQQQDEEGEHVPEDRESYWRPRKKRQCPECHLYFSNLATHKLTHLKPTLRPHVCKLCQRGFARPNDLFRHFKCHWKEIGADKGQFRCPFKNGPRGDHCCHLLGIFSRCDTYKNHLKAIHFQYPLGTKKSQRNTVPGLCRLCQAQFRTVDEWIVTHIDANQCPFAHHD